MVSISRFVVFGFLWVFCFVFIKTESFKSLHSMVKYVNIVMNKGEKGTGSLKFFFLAVGFQEYDRLY